VSLVTRNALVVIVGIMLFPELSPVAIPNRFRFMAGVNFPLPIAIPGLVGGKAW
jgi:hypothetical protein